MPKYEIEFGVTVYHLEVIEAPNDVVASDVAYALDSSGEYLEEVLRKKWAEHAASNADDFTDVVYNSIDRAAQTTMSNEQLEHYLSATEMRDYRKACIESEIKKAMEVNDWKLVAELASKLTKEN